MLSWRIAGNDWLLFTSDTVEQGIARNCVSALNNVYNVFNDWFGVEPASLRSPVSVIMGAQDYPQCFKTTGTVFLTSDTLHNPNMAVYQFAHELCHLLIPGNVTQRFKWFEETICRCASMSALRCIYGASCTQYINGILSGNAMIPEGKSVAAYIRSVLVLVDQDQYRRDINGAIAEALTSILTPAFWRRVPALCEISENTVFDDGINWFASALPYEEKKAFTSLVLGD